MLNSTVISPMSRSFNTAGPCQEDINYILPLTRRLLTLERPIA